MSKFYPPIFHNFRDISCQSWNGVEKKKKKEAKKKKKKRDAALYYCEYCEGNLDRPGRKNKANNWRLSASWVPPKTPRMGSFWFWKESLIGSTWCRETLNPRTAVQQPDCFFSLFFLRESFIVSTPVIPPPENPSWRTKH